MYLKITTQLDNQNMCIKIENMGWTLKQMGYENYIVVSMFKRFWNMFIRLFCHIAWACSRWLLNQYIIVANVTKL